MCRPRTARREFSGYESAVEGLFHGTRREASRKCGTAAVETDHGKLGSVVTGEGDPVAGLVAQQGHRFTQQRSDQQLTSSVAMDLTVVAEYLCKRDIGPPAGGAVWPRACE